MYLVFRALGVTLYCMLGINFALLEASPIWHTVIILLYV